MYIFEQEQRKLWKKIRTDHQMIQELMYYDEAETDRRLRAEQRRMEKAERRELAKAATLKEHPVMQFVRSLPVEETDQFRGNSIFAISSVYLDGNIQKTDMASS